MQKLPYAIANFLTIREENYLYIDRTAYIRALEAWMDEFAVKMVFTSLLFIVRHAL